VGAFLLIATGAFLFLFFAGMGAGAADPEAFRILGAIGLALVVFMALMAVPGLVAGYGILKRRSWARVIGIVVGALDLPLFPVGTVVGAYTLWVLTDRGSIDYFSDDVSE
jgi:hypothetical protein